MNVAVSIYYYFETQSSKTDRCFGYYILSARGQSLIPIRSCVYDPFHDSAQYQLDCLHTK
jgi:hypothetical protein